MSKYEELKTRFYKGYITYDQLQRFVELGVLTDEQAQTIVNLTQVEVIPKGVFHNMALEFMAESEANQDTLSSAAGYCAKEYDQWTAGKTYKAGQLLQYEGVALQVRQQVTAQAHQPPFSQGMTAIYIPIVTADQYGIKPYKYGVATKQGERFYGAGGEVYVHIAVDNPSNVYPPSSDLPAVWKKEGNC